MNLQSWYLRVYRSSDPTLLMAWKDLMLHEMGTNFDEQEAII